MKELKELNEYKARIMEMSEETIARNKKRRFKITALALCLVLAMTASLFTVFYVNKGGKREEGQARQSETSSETDNDSATVKDTKNASTVETVKAEKGKTVNLLEGISANRPAGDIDISSKAVKASDFAARLLGHCYENDKNTLVSPLSVLAALAMTMNGTDGETLSQMENAVGMTNEELNEFIYNYTASLPQGEKYRLDLANSVWIKENYSDGIKKQFLQTTADYFDAEVFSALFDQSTVDDINGWVSDKTKEMIPEVIKEIDEDTFMFLINASAFQAEWQSPFGQNYQSVFTNVEGNEKTAEFMMSTQDIAYINDGAAEGFVKYYKDKKYAFAALLPGEGTSISEYVGSLDGEKIARVLSSSKVFEKFEVHIPKFETGSDVDLMEVLKKMGITDAFNGRLADFSRLVEKDSGIDPYIGEAKHKTFISVSELGTKAGAATVIGIYDEMDYKTLFFNRPFVYMLIDCQTNIPFFIGTYVDAE